MRMPLDLPVSAFWEPWVCRTSASTSRVMASAQWWGIGAPLTRQTIAGIEGEPRVEWPNLPAWLKVSSTHLAAIAAAAGVLLFAPASFTAIIGAAPLIDSYRMWIGLVFLLCTSLLAARAVAWALRKAAASRNRARNMKLWQERLGNLSQAEATVLAGYVQSGTRTLYFQPSDGVAEGLVVEHIIFRSANVGDMMTGFPYNIQPWALKHLKAHPELLVSADAQQAAQLAADAEAIRKGSW